MNYTLVQYLPSSSSVHCSISLLEHVTGLVSSSILLYMSVISPSLSVKVWKSTWELFCSFIGHEGPVTGLSLYTNGPHIISSSLDSTIQLWDLRYGDTLETIHHTLPVHGIYSEPNHSKVITYSNKQLCIWNINQLYQKTTIIGLVVHVSIYLLMHLFKHLFKHLFIYSNIYSSIQTFIHLFKHLFIYSNIYPSIQTSIYPSIQTSIHLFKHLSIYSNIYLSISADCTQFLSTTHPAVPIRLIATCSDSAVRLISPVGGAIITTALLPLSVKVHTAVYKPLEGT